MSALRTTLTVLPWLVIGAGALHWAIGYVAAWVRDGRETVDEDDPMREWFV